ncbi:unnamed protein product, partial [Brachionus calyciflorus]
MKRLEYFFTCMVLIVSHQKVLFGDQIKEDGSCEMPYSLFKFNESIYDNLNNLTTNENLTTDFFKVSFTLTNQKTLYRPKCLDPLSTYVVYKFEIEDPMYLQIKQTSISQYNALYATITHSKCSNEFECFSLSSDPKVLFLNKGNYNLILSSITNHRNYYYNNYYDHSNNKNFELSFDLNQEPNFIGSFKNPKSLEKDAFFIRSKQILDETLSKNSYYTKLHCSKEKSPSVVYSFEVPSNTEVFLDINLFSTDGSNKLDTVLGIVDSDGQPIENWCNDDSHYIGGLSSYLNGLLTSGSYRLIASGYDFESYGNFRLEFSSKLYKIGTIGPIFLEDRLIEKFNSSFSINKDLFNCVCCLKKETN